jgi:nicotinamidase/pyrazinamidase|tara:strand:- start:686 stop:1315 length:630 start_codon:yes stop_codon:yes gene_type:complete
MINNSTDCLLVVDVQNDFCAGGALEVPSGEDVVDIINALAGQFEHRVLIQDWHPHGHESFASSHDGKFPFESVELHYGSQVLWPDHCAQGTKGAEFHAELKTDDVELIIRKGCRRGIDSYSAFFENDRTTPTGLSGYLRDRGFSRVFLAGLATDFCVAYSALDARSEGFEALLIEDACRAINLDNSLANAFTEMETAGVRRIGTADLFA